MLAAPERPAFYALGRGRASELLTLLHPPYTAWHLSYFALGAAVAPKLHADRLLWGLAAFALAVGVAAHAVTTVASDSAARAPSNGASSPVTDSGSVLPSLSVRTPSTLSVRL
ncbi:MAG TPA: hypothetical protein VNR42_09405, partial [Solirubrobacteraceae bacterium]|nr:hypothetical protein [Solirubrobacteraceae bacterium]